MNQSNSASEDKLEAYRQLLKNNIEPNDVIFQARSIINNLSSVDKYLVKKVITFETKTVIDANDDWNYIQPQTAFNYVSLNGKNAPSSNKIGTNGVVITFNEKEHGLFQFVLSTKGLGYRKINTPWLYLGQGIPADIDLSHIVDANHLSEYVNMALNKYATKATVKSAQNSQIAVNDNFNNRISNDESSQKALNTAESSSVSSLQSSVNYNFNNPSGIASELSSSTNTGFKSMNQQYDRDINTLYNDLSNNMGSQITSLTGSLGTSNDTSYYTSYSYSNIRVPSRMAQHYGSYSYDSNGSEYGITTPGSVYQEAQLMDSAYGTTSQAIDNVYNYLQPMIEKNVTSKDNSNAINDVNTAMFHAETINNHSYFDKSQPSNIGSIYANASNIASVKSSAASDAVSASQEDSELYSFTSSVAQVSQPSGYSVQDELMSLKAITPQNGPTILGNGYDPIMDTPNSNNMTSSELSTADIIQTANSIAYTDVNSFIDTENNLPAIDKKVTSNGTELIFNSSLLSNAANQGTQSLNDARDVELTDINNARKQKGLKPLQFAYENQIVANLRINALRYVYNHVAQQLQNDTDIHGEEDINNNISAYMSRISDALGFTSLLENIGENAATWRLGKTKYANKGYIDPHYVNKNSVDAANHIIDVYLNHDQSQQNGHRNNILNPNYRYIGVAYYYNPLTQHGVEIETFSKDVDKSAYIPHKINTDLVNLFIDPFNRTNDNNYNKYLLSNEINVIPGDTYSITGALNAGTLDTYGMIGVSTSPYLAQYDDPINTVQNANGTLNGNAVTFNLDKNDANSELNMGYINYYFVPKPNVTKLWIVGIPLVDNGTPTFKDVRVCHVKQINHIQAVNSLASENAENINSLQQQNSANEMAIGNFATKLYSLSSVSSNISSLNANPIMSLAATKSIASSLSIDSSEANQIYIYPRFTSAVGNNSRTEELAINWCNDAYYGNLQICEQDFESFVKDNYSQPQYTANEQYHEQVKDYARIIADINKDKVAAILGIIQAKTDFGNENGSDPKPNYIGYRDYKFEYNNVYDYLTNILQHTVGGWLQFQGTYQWNDGPIVTGLQMSDFEPFVNKNHPLQKDQLPYFYAAWLDFHIDNSNTDMDECGNDALELKKILY